MKYETMECRGFWLPTDPLARKVDFFDVLVAKGSWDGLEDADDEKILFYMDGHELQVGAIVSDGFVITEIGGANV
jgi:hypothetical protein